MNKSMKVVVPTSTSTTPSHLEKGKPDDSQSCSSCEYGFTWTSVPMAIGVLASITVLGVSILLSQNLQICMGVITLAVSLLGLYQSIENPSSGDETTNLESELSTAKSTISSLDSQISSLRQKLSEKLSATTNSLELGTLSSQLEGKKKELKKAEEELTKVEERLTSVNERIDKQEKLAKSTLDTVVEVENQLKKIKKVKEKKELELQELTGEVEKRKEKTGGAKSSSSNTTKPESNSNSSVQPQKKSIERTKEKQHPYSSSSSSSSTDSVSQPSSPTLHKSLSASNLHKVKVTFLTPPKDEKNKNANSDIDAPNKDSLHLSDDLNASNELRIGSLDDLLEDLDDLEKPNQILSIQSVLLDADQKK